MNCDECRDMMLEADPATLARRGDGDLAGHLRSCLTCRRMAATIVRDTRMLAGVVEHRQPAWRRPAVVAGLAAAALLLAVGLSVRNHARTILAPPAPRAVQRTAAIPRTDSSTQVAALPNEMRPPTQAASPVHAPRMARRPIRAAAYQPAAFVATPIRVTTEASEPAPMVSVRPLPGHRAAVFHTASSGVTIVWLY